MNNKKFDDLTNRIKSLCRIRDRHEKTARQIDGLVRPLVRRAARMIRQDEIAAMREGL